MDQVQEDLEDQAARQVRAGEGPVPRELLAHLVELEDEHEAEGLDDCDEQHVDGHAVHEQVLVEAVFDVLVLALGQAALRR